MNYHHSLPQPCWAGQHKPLTPWWAPPPVAGVGDTARSGVVLVVTASNTLARSGVGSVWTATLIKKIFVLVRRI